MLKKIILPFIIAALVLSGCSKKNEQTAEQINTQASEVKIMFYTAELESEITLMPGEELELHALAYAEEQEIEDALIAWTSSNEDVLTVSAVDNKTVRVKVLKMSDAAVELKASCGKAEKELTVHIIEQIK